MLADMPPAYVEFQDETQDGQWTLVGEEFLNGFGGSTGKAQARYRYNNFVIIGAHVFGMQNSEYKSHGWSAGASYNQKNSPHTIYVAFRKTDNPAMDLYQSGWSDNWAKGIEIGASYSFSNNFIGSVSLFKGKEEKSEERIDAGRIEISFLF